jgi:MFS family permease
MVSNPLKLLKSFPKQLQLMFFGMLISTIGASMVWPFLMIYVRKQVDIPLTQAASIMTINAAAGIIAAFIAGPITDRVGRKWVMVISLFGNGLAYFLLGFAHSFSMFALLMALSGTFNPLYRVGSDAMIADLIPPEKRADAYALMRLSNNAGISIGPMIGGFISSVSFSISFSLAATGMIIYSLLLAFYAHETLPAGITLQEKTIKTFSGYLQVLGDSKFLSFIVSFILVQMCAAMIWILLPVYANNIYNIPEKQYGFIPTTNALMVVLLQIYITRRTKRFAPLPVLTVGTAFYAIAIGSVALSHSFFGFWICIVIMTIGELIIMPTASTYVADLAPADMRGRYMSVAGLTWSAAAGTGPLIGGYLNDKYAPVATWYGGFLIGIIGILGFLYLSRKEMRAQEAVLPE